MRTRKRRDGIERKNGAKDLADARGGDFFSDVLDMYAPPEFIRLRKMSVGRAGFERDKAAIRSYFQNGQGKSRVSESEEERPDGPPAQSGAAAPGKEVRKILSKLPRDTPPDVIEAIAQLDYSGPLPLPAMMREYESVKPGPADRIMRLAENEQQIRKRDNGRILFNDGVRIWGSVFVSLCLIAAGVFLRRYRRTMAGAYWAHRVRLRAL